MCLGLVVVADVWALDGACMSLQLLALSHVAQPCCCLNGRHVVASPC